MNNNNDQLGKLITGDDVSYRDAVHIAIAPMKAAMRLFAGQEIGLDENGKAVLGYLSKKPLGIVDPFLTKSVYPDQDFYMCLFPNTVTGMRHAWVHPAFEDDAFYGSVEKFEENESEQWLKNFAEEICITYEQLIGAIETWLDTQDGEGWGHHFCFNGVDTPSESYDQREDMWKHYKNLNRKAVPDHCFDDHIFTCSC